MARVDGDEFVIGLTGYQSSSQSELLARSVLGIFDRRFSVGGIEVAVGCSVGVARCSGQSEISLLLTMSDVAMYRAKRAGGRQWRLHEAGSEPSLFSSTTDPARPGR